MTKYNKNPIPNMLIIDDEKNMRHMLQNLLSKCGYDVDTVCDGFEGIKIIKETEYNFILCDLKMPKLDGIGFLKESGEYLQDTTVIMMSAYGTIDTAIEAIKLGAYDFISKPFKSEEIILVLDKAKEQKRLKRENFLLRERIKTIEENYQFSNMIGKSASMQSIFRLLSKIAGYSTTVLVTGESGTGKELIARALHLNSERCDQSMIPVNCGGIPENLLESELFGYVKGAFTGADKDKKGLFQEADKGTIFLDEIGELPFNLQVKLLRVLQENEVRPVGASISQKLDIRIIAATAKNLEEEVKNGNFREDLFYRLNVLPVKLPPLRERIEDIPLLCDSFIKKYSIKLKKDVNEISTSALSILFKHTWPGNIRELENIIERAVVLAEDNILQPVDFPSELLSHGIHQSSDTEYEGFSLKMAKKILERKMIIKALESTDGNRTKSARLLEISHPSLLSKIKLYNIDL